ncbi:MAG: hypothetical protein U9R72_11190 [Chloroflexota bacterium]|nr:hypothetical protein [Chloroflexota bacterium]
MGRSETAWGGGAELGDQEKGVVTALLEQLRPPVGVTARERAWSWADGLRPDQDLVVPRVGLEREAGLEEQGVPRSFSAGPGDAGGPAAIDDLGEEDRTLGLRRRV